MSIRSFQELDSKLFLEKTRFIKVQTKFPFTKIQFPLTEITVSNFSVKIIYAMVTSVLLFMKITTNISHEIHFLLY